MRAAGEKAAILSLIEDMDECWEVALAGRLVATDLLLMWFKTGDTDRFSFECLSTVRASAETEELTNAEDLVISVSETFRADRGGAGLCLNLFGSGLEGVGDGSGLGALVTGTASYLKRAESN